MHASLSRIIWYQLGNDAPGLGRQLQVWSKKNWKCAWLMVGGVAQWLGRRSVAIGLSLIYA